MRNLRVILPICMLWATLMRGQDVPPSDSQAKSDDPPCGMIYGKNHFLSICAPSGWTFDNSILVSQGIYATFYREAFTFKEAVAWHTIMYVNVETKGEGQQNATELMKLDAEKTRRASPKLVLQHGSLIVIPGDKGTTAITVPVQSFLNGYQGSNETVAYIENDKTIVMVVISSVSNELLQKDYPDFVKLVQSYRFFSSNVTITH